MMTFAFLELFAGIVIAAYLKRYYERGSQRDHYVRRVPHALPTPAEPRPVALLEAAE